MVQKFQLGSTHTSWDWIPDPWKGRLADLWSESIVATECVCLLHTGTYGFIVSNHFICVNRLLFLPMQVADLRQWRKDGFEVELRGLRRLPWAEVTATCQHDAWKMVIWKMILFFRGGFLTGAIAGSARIHPLSVVMFVWVSGWWKKYKRQLE